MSRLVQRKGLKSLELSARSKEICAKSYVLNDCKDMGVPDLLPNTSSSTVLSSAFFRFVDPVSFVESFIPYILPKCLNMGLAVVLGSSAFPGLLGALREVEKLGPGLCSLGEENATL